MMIVRKHFLKEFTLQCINFAALQKSKFYNEKFTLKPLFILTQNVKFGYSQVTQRRYSRREFPREFGRTNTQKSEWVHFFYRKFPYFSQREFPKVSAVMGTQKHCDNTSVCGYPLPRRLWDDIPNTPEWVWVLRGYSRGFFGNVIPPPLDTHGIPRVFPG